VKVVAAPILDLSNTFSLRIGDHSVGPIFGDTMNFDNTRILCSALSEADIQNLYVAESVNYNSSPAP